MSPPAATYDTHIPQNLNGNGVAIKKELDVKSISNGKNKTLSEMTGLWDSFRFCPIRESQVSRAMSEYMALTQLKYLWQL